MANFSSMPYGAPNVPSASTGGSVAANPFVTTYSDVPAGKPQRPDFITIGDPQTGLLQAPYNIQSNLNPDAMNQLRYEALRQGPSRWSTLAQADAANKIARQQAGLTNQAKNQLAMTGGLRTGSAERLAKQGLRGGLAAKQNAYGQIAMQDEATRQATLRSLPGAEIQQAGYLSNIQKANIDAARNELGQKRAQDMGVYTGDMRSWAAEQMANAVPGQTPSGGFMSGGIGGALNPLNPLGQIGGVMGIQPIGGSIGSAINSVGSGISNAVGSVLGGGGGK